MHGTILVLNAGSSSVKFSLFEAREPDGLELRARGQVEGIGTAPRFLARDGAGAPLAERRWPADASFDHERAIDTVLRWLEERRADARLLAAGHRVVHGGPDFAAPVRIDREVLSRLEALCPLAPLHQPHNLAGIRALLRLRPALPQVACFDTAFHRARPPVADRFALPGELFAAGVRRYGFHGLSYESILTTLAERDPALAGGRLLVAHLGNGASLCAIRDGRPLDTTMSFTPLDGLVMGTRPGSLDPGVLLHLLTAHGMDAAALEDLLYHRSGLLGVSDISSDMRDLLARADEPAAALAVELFVYRAVRETGGLVAVTGGLDGLVFTGGIGEHAPEIRARICRRLGWLGLALDEAANARGDPLISAPDSRVAVHVIATDEERMIARHTRALLAG